MLFAMGGYGTYLGFRIRFSDDLVSELLKHMFNYNVYQEQVMYFICTNCLGTIICFDMVI